MCLMTVELWPSKNCRSVIDKKNIPKDYIYKIYKIRYSWI